MFTGEVIGYLGADAKSTTKEDKTVINFSVSALSKSQNEDPTWISCFSNRHSHLVDYLKKGTKVYVSGDLKCGVFKKENGDVIPSVNMTVSKIELLGKKND